MASLQRCLLLNLLLFLTLRGAVKGGDLPACVELAIKEAYPAAEDDDSQIAILDRLKQLEQALTLKDCLISSKLPDSVCAAAPALSSSAPPVGPADFVRRLQERLANQAKKHVLPLIQPVGLTFDTQSVLDLSDLCRPEIDISPVDKERPQLAQNWTMCDVVDDFDVELEHIWKGLKTVLGNLLHALWSSHTLQKLSFSIVEPGTLVEWHVDYAYDLLSESGLECNVTTHEHFSSMDLEATPEDSGASWGPTRHMQKVRLHLPLSAQDGVRFFVSGSAVSMHPGELLVLDFYQPHSLYNVGSIPRVNMLIDFDLTALNDEVNSRKLLHFEEGRMVLAAILKMGYQNPEMNAVRQDLEKLLHEYYHSACAGNETLDEVTELRRLMLERKHAGLHEQNFENLLHEYSNIKGGDDEEDDED